MRELTRELTTARDAQVAQVVALIDSMQQRGTADALIAPLRARLRQLRPDRPLRFGRLLFLPLDPVISDGPGWRLGMPAVPRPALGPLLEIVQRGLAEQIQEIEAEIRGRSHTDTVAIRRAGGLLWPRAARLLKAAASAPIDRAWKEAGLPADAFAPVAKGLACVLSRAVPLMKALADADSGVPPRAEQISEMLEHAAADSAEGWGLMVAVLLRSLPEPGLVLRQMREISARLQPALRAVAERTIEAVLEQLAGTDGEGGRMRELGFTAAAEQVRRLAELLDGLSGGAGPQRQRAIGAARQKADAKCRDLFAAGLSAELIQPLHALGANPEPGSIKLLEATARELRRFETEARRIDGADSYDAMLRRAAREIAGDGKVTLSLIDRVRMVELLAGPEDALRLLGA
jgi:hypothetical protein